MRAFAAYRKGGPFDVADGYLEDALVYAVVDRKVTFDTGDLDIAMMPLPETFRRLWYCFRWASVII